MLFYGTFKNIKKQIFLNKTIFGRALVKDSTGSFSCCVLLQTRHRSMTVFFEGSKYLSNSAVTTSKLSLTWSSSLKVLKIPRNSTPKEQSNGAILIFPLLSSRNTEHNCMKTATVNLPTSDTLSGYYCWVYDRVRTHLWKNQSETSTNLCRANDRVSKLARRLRNSKKFEFLNLPLEFLKCNEEHLYSCFIAEK